MTEKLLTGMLSINPNKTNKSLRETQFSLEIRVLGDSDQPVQPPSLIKDFTDYMKKAQVFSYPSSTAVETHQTRQLPRLISVLAGRKAQIFGFATQRLRCVYMVFLLFTGQSEGWGM